MRMRGWTIGLLAFAALAAGCPNCPTPPPMPGNRLVGLAGAATSAPLGMDAGWDLEALAYQGDRLLVVSRDDGLMRLDPARGGRTPFEPAGPLDDATGTLDVVATGSGGTTWLSDGARIYRLGAGDALARFDDGEPPAPSSSPSPSPSASPSPGPSASPSPGPGATPPAAPSAAPSPRTPPVFPSPDTSQLWGSDGIQALADDGAGGAWVARGEWIWHATPDGARVRAVAVPRAVEDLVQWNGGLVVRLARRNWDDADEETLLELVPGKAPAPWRHALPTRRSVAIAAAPDGALIVASEATHDGVIGYRTGDVYDTMVERVGADGRRRTLVEAEKDAGKPGGYKIMMSCAGPDYPDEFDVGALAVANDGRVAFVLARRDRLVVWRP